jgi:hypothetical protein
LDRGNGDPSLVDFGQEITPNYHAIARQFVDLDNFYNTGDVSGDGHIWSFGGRENDLSAISIPQNYSGRGPAYDSEGQNRDINVGLPDQPSRLKSDPIGPTDPDVLPGTADVGAVDGPGDDDIQKGYIWDSVTRAGRPSEIMAIIAIKRSISCRMVRQRRLSGIHSLRSFELAFPLGLRFLTTLIPTFVALIPASPISGARKNGNGNSTVM